MKRTVLSLILVAIICSVGFAEENLSGEKTFAAFVIEFGGINRLLLGKNKNDFEGYAKTNHVLTIGFRTLK